MSDNLDKPAVDEAAEEAAFEEAEEAVVETTTADLTAENELQVEADEAAERDLEAVVEEAVAEVESAVNAAQEAVADSDLAADAVVGAAIEEAVQQVEAVSEAVDAAVADLVDAAEAAVDESLTERTETADDLEDAVAESDADPVADAAAEAVLEAESAAAAILGAAVEAAAEDVEDVAAAVEAAVSDVEVAAVVAVENAIEEAVSAVDAVASEAEAAQAAQPTAADATDDDAAAEDAKDEDDEDAITVEGADGQTRVVRRLAVGQEVEGVVKRTTEFGAFVDIGVGRDGLVHISELDTRRVGKVTDVLKEGESITVWIKKLDRQRNRISLTLIPPGTKTIRDLQKGEIVSGTVTRIVPYGAFIDIGVGRDALLHVREMAEGYVAKPDDVVREGEALEARIIEVSRRRGRIDLSLKGLRPEPEAEAPEVAEADEEEVEDPYANVEVLSPMELAFRKAMAEETEDVAGTTKKRSKRARRDDVRALQDEIISRTLESGPR